MSKNADASSAPHPSASQVAALEEKLADREARAQLLHRELNGAKEALEGAGSEAQEHMETVGLLKDKYTAAMRKVHEVQGQAEQLQEELQYSQQQVIPPPPTPPAAILDWWVTALWTHSSIH